MKELSPFQTKCREKLYSIFISMDLDHYDLRIYETEERRLSAEMDVVIEISVGELMVLIYENGGHIRRKDRNKNIPFEDRDYDSQEDLIKDFTENVIFFLLRRRGNMNHLYDQLWGDKEDESAMTTPSI